MSAKKLSAETAKAYSLYTHLRDSGGGKKDAIGGPRAHIVVVNCSGKNRQKKKNGE